MEKKEHARKLFEMFVSQRPDLPITDAIDYVVESLGMHWVDACEACGLTIDEDEK